MSAVFLLPLFLTIEPSDNPGEIAFPRAAGVLDVRDFGARGDGTTDDTAAIQAALDHDPSGNRIVYLPPGTYRVSDQLRWPPSSDERSRSGSAHKRTILQGAGRDRSVIRLQDNCPGFETARTEGKNGQRLSVPRGRGVVWTGTAPAQRFRNAVRDLTIDVGFGNAGAAALQFNANNQGRIENVTLRDGSAVSGQPADRAAVGLDFGYTGEIGPLLARGVRVDGFRVGVHHAALNMVTLEDLHIVGGTQAGIVNSHVLPLRRFRYEGVGPAIVCEKQAFTVLLDAQLTTVATPAIPTQRPLVVLDATLGSPGRLSDHESLTILSEEPLSVASQAWHTLAGDRVQPAATPELVPLVDVPPVPWETALASWRSPLDFEPDAAAVADDPRHDDAPAIQAAIDAEGCRTVFLPGDRSFTLHSDVVLRGDVQRLIGCEGQLKPPRRGKGDDSPPGRLIIGEGTADPVMIERLDTGHVGLEIVIDTDRTVILSSLLGPRRIIKRTAGRLFLDDIVCRQVVVDHPEAEVFARQLNTEFKEEPNVQVLAGRLAVLGHKTENADTKLLVRDGHATVYGAHIYANQKVASEPPLYRVTGRGQLDLLGVRQTFWPPKTKPFTELVQTPGGTLTREANPTGWHLPLLTVSPAGESPIRASRPPE